MPQTLRKTFSFTAHTVLRPMMRRALNAPFSYESMLLELHRYLQLANRDLLQPRQQSIDLILREALN